MAPPGVIRPIPPDIGEPQVAVRPRRDPGGRTAGFVGSGYSVMRPRGVIRPIRLPVQLKFGSPRSVNHMLPSGPAAIPWGRPP